MQSAFQLLSRSLHPHALASIPNKDEQSSPADSLACRYGYIYGVDE